MPIGPLADQGPIFLRPGGLSFLQLLEDLPPKNPLHFPCVSKQCPAGLAREVSRQGSQDAVYPLREVLETRFTPSEST